MKDSKNAHCLITVRGRDRRVFSMVEKPDGYLMIGFQALDFMGEGYEKEYEGQKIISQKYSIHTSESSTTEINAIKHTVVLENGQEITSNHYTNAIKKNKRFAYVASVMCPDLDQNKYIPKSLARNKIRLGSYDPLQTSLHYALFIGSRGLKFSPEESLDFSYDCLDFKLFRVVVLWSLAPIPSSFVGIKAHHQTARPEDVAQEDKGLHEQQATGLEVGQSVSIFRHVRNQIHYAYLSRLVSKDPEFAADAGGIFRLGHYKVSTDVPSEFIRRRR